MATDSAKPDAIRRRGSIRVWQTVLFVVVIVVAMLIMSGSLSAGLQAVLTRMAETTELRNASALAQRLAPSFPIETAGTAQVEATVDEYRGVYGGGIWVYDKDGQPIVTASDVSVIAPVIEAAQLGGLGDEGSYVASDLKSDGWVVAAKPIEDARGEPVAVVVTASTPDEAVAILGAVRDRLWVTFWVSLAVATLVGLVFSDMIARRIGAMNRAAIAIADGDFEQRLPIRLVPDEIQELAASYNRMTERLGVAFAEISEGRRQLAAIIESMAEGVLAFDERGVVRVANPEADRLLAAAPGSLIGEELNAMHAPAESIELVRTGLLGTPGIGTVDVGPHTVLMHCTPLTDADGASDGAVLLLADVTEQRQMEEAQRRFVADASHEMRTPISAIKGMVELLEDGAKENPKVRDDFLHTIAVESDRLSRLVGDLLTLARLESGSLRLEQTSEFVADLLDEVSRVMAPLAEQSGVRVSVEAPDEELRVLADRDRIKQVLISFTDNALKHSGADTTVTLRARARDGAVRFEVADEGVGMSAEDRARVFERFYRADTSRSGGGGTGLGLAIAKEMIEAHGSSIDVDSIPGRGTTFSFDLPLA